VIPRLARRDHPHVGCQRGPTGVCCGLARLTNLASPATLHCMAPKTRETAISQLRRGVLEFCVLALLRDGERYSYELVTALGNADGLVTTEGTLYPLLARLRREGVVDTTWRESNTGPPRRYYHLTPDGKTALSGFVTDWARFRDSVDALLGNGVLR
jgi:PadR family transcriptional regulator PadR